MSFSNLGLSQTLQKKLEDLNYTEPYPIQIEAIPAILKNKDLLGIAKTGSGKTASFVLPLLMNLQGRADGKNRHVKILILVPTRELAVQVNDVVNLFAEAMPGRVKSSAVFGGVSINPQMMNLQNTDILVATPGRLLDLVERNAVHLSDIDSLVLDEADKMLNAGFKKEINQILDLLPQQRQNLLFSATLNEDVSNIERMLLHNPVVVKIESEEKGVDLINQSAYLVAPERKGLLLRYLIKSKDMKQVLIFTSSGTRAENVANKLRKNGIDAMAIHKKKTQGVRTDTLTKFKHGHLTALVSTDLLSRGIDIEFLPYVINYEMPRSPKTFIHRIGRTGRAESPGEAISLISPEEEHQFKVIEKKMKKRINKIETDDLDLK